MPLQKCAIKIDRVVGTLNIDAWIVFAHPGIDVLHIEGHGFAHARNFLPKGMDGGMEEILQKRAIQLLQLLAQPICTRNALLGIKTIRLAGIEDQTKAQFNHQQGMLEQKVPQVRGVAHVLLDAQ